MTKYTQEIPNVRETEYGDATENFNCAAAMAALFKAHNGSKEDCFSGVDGMFFMLFLKIARCAGALKDGRNPSIDTLRDIAGYAEVIEKALYPVDAS